MLPPSKINGSFVNKAIFADGCIIMADKIEHSLIGNRTRIEKKGSTVIRFLISWEQITIKIPRHGRK